MTVLGMEYLKHQETLRHNQAAENEQNRSNLQSETLRSAELAESKRRTDLDAALRRSNLDYQYASLEETARANRARETEAYRSNLAKETETNRSNLARELETERSNKKREFLDQAKVLSTPQGIAGYTLSSIAEGYDVAEGIAKAAGTIASEASDKISDAKDKAQMLHTIGTLKQRLKNHASAGRKF